MSVTNVVSAVLPEGVAAAATLAASDSTTYVQALLVVVIATIIRLSARWAKRKADKLLEE